MADNLAHLDIVGFGEAMVLVAPDDGRDLEHAETVGLHVAGAEFNVCVAAAALGAHTAFASLVGDDPLGHRIRAAAVAHGVDVALLGTSPAPTGVFFKDIRPDGQRRVHYYRAGSAASTMDAELARRILRARPEIVVVSGITAALSTGSAEAVEVLLRGAAEAGVRVALDPNLRPALGPVPDQAARLLPLLPHVDLLLLGTDESPYLFGSGDPARVLAAASAAGVRETVLKAGPDGCYVLDDGELHHLASAATAVVDPAGAGDAFAGGYLVGRVRGMSGFAAAWLGTQLAARAVASAGDLVRLAAPATAASLLSAAQRVRPLTVQVASPRSGAGTNTTSAGRPASSSRTSSSLPVGRSTGPGT